MCRREPSDLDDKDPLYARPLTGEPLAISGIVVRLAKRVRKRVRKRVQKRGLVRAAESFAIDPFARFKFRACYGGQTDAPPLSTIEVDPRAIRFANATALGLNGRRTKHLEDLPRPRYAEWSPMGGVLGGDWDRYTVPFSQCIEDRMARERYEQGIPWEQTEAYRELMMWMSRRRPDLFRCRGPGELMERLRYLDSLAASLAAHGYRESAAHETPRPPGATPPLSDYPDEIQIRIGRHGELLYARHGRHRLAIARALGLSRIPVLVWTRHGRWQRIRDELRSAHTRARLSAHAEAHVSHPDLADLAPP